VHVEGFYAAPAKRTGAGAAQTFGYECARVWNVGETGMNRVGSWIKDEVIDRLRVGSGTGTGPAR
jgi:hypothetical protein